MGPSTSPIGPQSGLEPSRLGPVGFKTRLASDVAFKRLKGIVSDEQILVMLSKSIFRAGFVWKIVDARWPTSVPTQ